MMGLRAFEGVPVGVVGVREGLWIDSLRRSRVALYSY